MNGSKRRPWDERDRQRFREQCLRDQPWRHATGPRTPQGKARSAANGRRAGPEPGSRRQLRASVADVRAMADYIAGLRRSLERADDDAAGA